MRLVINTQTKQNFLAMTICKPILFLSLFVSFSFFASAQDLSSDASKIDVSDLAPSLPHSPSGYSEEKKEDVQAMALRKDTCALFAKLLNVKNRNSDNEDLESEMLDRYVVEMIREAMYKDLKMKNNFAKLTETGRVKVVVSDDKRVRMLMWKNSKSRPNYSTGSDYSYIVQYGTVKGKSRVEYRSHYYNAFGSPLHEEFLGYDIDCIEYLQNGTYLFFCSKKGTTKIMGIDLLLNSFSASPVFKSEGDRRYSHLYQVDYTPKQSTDNLDFILKGNTLEMPVFDKAGAYTGERAKLYFNGIYFEDYEPYQVKVDSAKIKGGNYIGALSFRNKNMQIITSHYPGQRVTLIAQNYNDGVHYEDDGKLSQITLRDDEDENFPNIVIKLPTQDWRMVVAGLPPSEIADYYYQCRDTLKVGTPNVSYVVGDASAYDDQYVIYTAVCYDKDPTDEEYAMVRWAVEVEGKLTYLDTKKYNGPQIKLLMNEKWVGKTITVYAYINYLSPTLFPDAQAQTEVLGSKVAIGF